MKKVILKVVIIMLVFLSVNANAEAYYTNNNGIEFTEFQYNTLVDILSEKNVAEFTLEEYEQFKVENMVEGNYEYTTQEFEVPEAPYQGALVPYGLTHETTSKKLTLSKGCFGDHCDIVLTVSWKKTPAVTSYDVIGVRLVNTVFYDSTNSLTHKYGSTYKSGYDGSKKTGEGLGDAFKITSDIDYATLAVRVNNTSNGVVYGSYQHAVKTVTLAKATNFTFSGTGYGSVFVWPSSYGQIYDQMAGVSTKLN